MNDLPVRFIGSPIEALFEVPPTLEKRPGAPSGFVWDDRSYTITKLLHEWHDYSLRGKARAFYEKEQGSFRAQAAGRRGTWGVGRDYYRVEVEGGDVYDLYYDRAPGTGHRRKGGWHLFRQIIDPDAVRRD